MVKLMDLSDLEKMLSAFLRQDATSVEDCANILLVLDRINDDVKDKLSNFTSESLTKRDIVKIWQLMKEAGDKDFRSFLWALIKRKGIDRTTDWEQREENVLELLKRAISEKDKYLYEDITERILEISNSKEIGSYLKEITKLYQRIATPSHPTEIEKSLDSVKKKLEIALNPQ